MEKKPHIMVIEAPFYRDIAAELAKGALQVLDAAGATYERFEVPGALEIPTAMVYGIKMKQFRPAARRFDGFLALGCIIKGETYHFEVVCNESARGIHQLATEYSLAVGNGVLTTYTEEQAMARAKADGENKGGAAAQTCLDMLAIKKKLGLYPRD
jgi:6,7-dimethyl-8-ribityllumazine synthase